MGDKLLLLLVLSGNHWLLRLVIGVRSLVELPRMPCFPICQPTFQEVSGKASLLVMEAISAMEPGYRKGGKRIGDIPLGP